VASPARPAPLPGGRAASSADTPADIPPEIPPEIPPPAAIDSPSPLPADRRFFITREGLRDGSLLAAARLHMPPDTTLLPETVIEADLDARLAQHPPDADAWLFGYGSLMWNPAIEYAECRPGAVHGWHRRFCLWLHGGRGSPDNPGLMLALERGGSCAGLLFRIPAAEARAELLLAWRREMFTGAYLSRWVTAMTAAGPVRAVTFVVNRAYSHYAGRLDEAEVAVRLASATGTLGSCAMYLAETLGALHAAGLRDRSLERLQRLGSRMPG
jgi:cation transport protein ChaC